MTVYHLDGTLVKNSPAKQEIQETGVRFPGLGRFPGNNNPLSILAWTVPRIEEPGGLQSTELQRVGHD